MPRFIESIKVEDGKMSLIDLHQQRINSTFNFHKKTCKMDLYEIFEDINFKEKELYKLRIIYDLENNFEYDLIKYIEKQITDFDIVIDNNIIYDFKYENRIVINTLKQTTNADEIIIVKNNQITDTSYSNLLLLKNDIWYTPKTFLLNGVQRQHLIKSGKVLEKDINLENLSTFSHIQIINALNPFDEMKAYPISKIRNLRPIL